MWTAGMLRRDVDAILGQMMACLARLGVSNSMDISKKVSWCCPIGAGPETAKLKRTLLRCKRAWVVAAALLTVSAIVVVAIVILAAGVIWTCTGWIFAPIRQRTRRRKALSDQCLEGDVDFNSPSACWNTIARPYAGTPVSICKNHLVVGAKSDAELELRRPFLPSFRSLLPARTTLHWKS